MSASFCRRLLFGMSTTGSFPSLRTESLRLTVDGGRTMTDASWLPLQHVYVTTPHCFHWQPPAWCLLGDNCRAGRHRALRIHLCPSPTSVLNESTGRRRSAYCMLKRVSRMISWPVGPAANYCENRQRDSCPDESFEVRRSLRLYLTQHFELSLN